MCAVKRWESCFFLWWTFTFWRCNPCFVLYAWLGTCFVIGQRRLLHHHDHVMFLVLVFFFQKDLYGLRSTDHWRMPCSREGRGLNASSLDAQPILFCSRQLVRMERMLFLDRAGGYGETDRSWRLVRDVSLTTHLDSAPSPVACLFLKLLWFVVASTPV